jgi:hypothetical protein
MKKEDVPFLDDFGANLMHRVRDDACHFLGGLLAGLIRGPWAEGFQAELKDQSLTPEQLDFVGRLLGHAVTTSIASFLQFIDEKEIAMLYRDANGEKRNIQAISDGLAGELYTERGWIARFSKYKEGDSVKRTS